MLIYVNGDSHAAGAEAVNSYCFAEDDPNYSSMGRRPHPANERVCWATVLASKLRAAVLNRSESASSNSRILRETLKDLTNLDAGVVVIGWSSWEREEWWHEGKYWQVNAAPPGHDWPPEIQKRHREWVTTVNYDDCMKMWHDKIWGLHKVLKQSNVPHLFFNCFSEFTGVEHRDWGQNYIGPYDSKMVYQNWLKDRGFKTVNPKSYHYGPDAHAAWAEFLTPQLTLTLLT